MQFLPKEVFKLLRDSFGGSVAAFFAFVLAVALDLLERKCERLGVSAWLLHGMSALSKIIFVTDFYVIVRFCLKVIVRAK